MKKTLSFILSLIMVLGVLTSVPVTVSAASVDDLTFELNEDGESYSVADCNESVFGELVIPITYKGLLVTNIGDFAFENCQYLESISIPDSVTNIGKYAFRNCVSLKSIAIPYGVSCIGLRVFQYCASLESITIPDSVISIGDEAFSESSLTSITIPCTVKTIGQSAFRACPNLTTVIIGEGVTSIGNYAFYDCTSVEEIYWNAKNIDAFNSDSSVFYNAGTSGSGIKVVFGDSVEKIPAYLFSVNDYSYAPNIVSVTIGDNVKSISESAFRECYNLTDVYISDMSVWFDIDFEDLEANPLCYAVNLYENGELVTDVVIPDGVTKIQICGFSFNSLESITIPDSVTIIGDYAFSGCTNLLSITIPDSVTNIGVDAFYNCDNLTSIEIPDSVTSVGEYAFGSCDNLTSIEIPDSVTSIGGHAFYNCDNLASIEILDGVTHIGEYAFDNCDNLTAVKLSDNITTISVGTFRDCLRLESIVIPDDVTIIDSNAFSGCIRLTSISLPNSITSVGDYAFNDCQNLKYVFYNGSEREWTDIDISTAINLIGWSNNYFLSSTIHYNSKGHNLVEIIINPSSCKNNGLKYCKCAVCGYETQMEIINATGHDSSDWLTDKEATVYKAGSKHKECTECGEILKTATIPQLKCAKPVLKKVYNANSYVKVTWGTVKGADLYRVYRKTGTGDYEYIGSTTHTYFNDKEAGAGKTCRYRIRAKNEAGYSEYSATLAVKHIDEPTLKSIENSAYGVLIKWDRVTGAEKYNVYRKVSGGEYEYIGVTENAYYTDKTAESGTKYYYAIRGKRDDSVSSQSASLSKYYLADPTLNTPSSSSKGIGLRWSQVEGADGYMVYRRTADGSYKLLTTEEGVSNVTFRDTTAKKGTKYYYKVKAYKSKTYSAYSNTKSVTAKY